MINHDKISQRKAKQVLLCLGLMLCFASVAIFSNISNVQGKVKGEWVLPKDYPDGFDGWGYIGSIDKKGIVIDDIQYKLSSAVEYHTPPGIARSRSKFRPGALVGFLKNSKDEIISLWLIRVHKK